MDVKGLIEAVRRRPFRPIRIELHDGRRFLIRTPEQILVTENTIIVAERMTAEGVVEESRRLTASDIARYEFFEPTEPQRLMNANELLELIRRRPFVPVRIHLTDGTAYEIRHPEQLWVLRGRVDIAVPADVATGLIDRVEHGALVHIVRVEDLEPAASNRN